MKTIKSILRYFASQRFARYIKVCQLIVDLLLLNLAYPISLWIRYGNIHKLSDNEVKTIWFFSNLIWIALVLYKDAYKLLRVEHIETLLGRTIKIFILHGTIIAITIIILDYDNISRLRIIIFFTIFYFLISVFRTFFLKLLKYIRSLGYNFRRVIIVGANENGRRMSEVLQSDLSYGYRVEGFFDDTFDKNNLFQDKYLGKLSDISIFLEMHKINEMYVALHFDESVKITELIQLADKYLVRIKFVPDFYEYTKARKVNIDFYDNIPVLMLRKEPLEIPENRLVKKIFDISFSLFVICFVCSWLFPILITLIKLTSKGPVFFKQLRSGEDNKSFLCYKFRTMQVNNLSDEIQATVNDPRITRIGAFMRKNNLDELPQFFNVLMGHMSVVGPRPHMLRHTSQYSELIHNYLVRHFTKPGITGWSQINGYRGETKDLYKMKKRVEYDIWYIENWSFLLDLKIVLRTVGKMLYGDDKAL
jgi:putative colanic acid biosynthesis UDP-glucose lipid carrier transferase